MGFRPGHPVRHRFGRALQAQLDVVHAGVSERAGPIGGESHAAGDQVDIHAMRAGPGREELQVASLQRLAAGQVGLQHSESAGLAEDVKPRGSRQLLRRRSQLRGIRAVRAVQRASVREFGEQTERRCATRDGLSSGWRSGVCSCAGDCRIGGRAACRGRQSVGVTWTGLDQPCLLQPAQDSHDVLAAHAAEPLAQRGGDASHAGSPVDQRDGSACCRVKQGHALRVQQRHLAADVVVAKPHPRPETGDDLFPAHGVTYAGSLARSETA